MEITPTSQLFQIIINDSQKVLSWTKCQVFSSNCKDLKLGQKH